MQNTVSEREQKQQFALELLKDPTDPFKAALRVFGENTGMALLASNRWPDDPEVLAITQKAVDELGDMHFLPSKADLARLAWNTANNERIDTDNRIKAMRLYGDIRGFIEKQGTVINNNVLTNNKVMVVKDHGGVEEWERGLLEQQQRLISDADTVRQ